MFFTTTEEIQQHCGINVSFEFEEAKVYLERADREFLIKHIGQDFFDELQADYDSENDLDELDPEIKSAIIKLRNASAAYAISLWVPIGQVQIDSSGIRIANTDTLKTAFQWQIKDLIRALKTSANSAMEDALKFFSDNTSLYPTFASSSAYTAFNNLFIKTADEFTSYVSVLNGSFLNLLKLRPSMITSEEFEIRSTLFDTYFEALKERVNDASTTPEDDAVLVFIKPAVAKLTISRAINDLACSLDEDGFLAFDNVGGTDLQNGPKGAAHVELNKIKTAADRDAKVYLTKLRKYLEDNKGDYSEYTSDPNYVVYDSTTYINKADNGHFYAG